MPVRSARGTTNPDPLSGWATAVRGKARATVAVDAYGTWSHNSARAGFNERTMRAVAKAGEARTTASAPTDSAVGRHQIPGSVVRDAAGRGRAGVSMRRAVSGRARRPGRSGRRRAIERRRRRRRPPTVVRATLLPCEIPGADCRRSARLPGSGETGRRATADRHRPRGCRRAAARPDTPWLRSRSAAP